MCDTMVAYGRATAAGGMLFAKNSDRERNEAQHLEFHPGRRYGRGAVLRATYIPIPQAPRTHPVLISRPFWMWGAEMGANAHGVVIGNEAVHARQAPERTPALLGMDLLRLGLERGASAAEAVEVMTALLERHGQGGSCGHLQQRFYQNSFIVADPREAFVLETMGRHFVVQAAPELRAISNTYTIGRDFLRASSGFAETAAAQGWRAEGAPFDPEACVTDPHNPGLIFARGRCARATELLERGRFRLRAAEMMRILRDHGAEAEGRAAWHPREHAGRTICMHAAEEERGGQTAGSLVSDLRETGAVHWVTGCAAPCTGIFKPVFMEAGLPDTGPEPGDLFDAATLWWRHERLHRALLRTGDILRFAAERDALEARFIERVEPALRATGADAAALRRDVSAQCWREAEAMERRWLAETGTPVRGAGSAYDESWARHDRLAEMPAPGA